MFYRGCQKNVPIEDRFSATNPYTAIIFSEHYYDKRYNWLKQRKSPLDKPILTHFGETANLNVVKA